MAVVREVQLEVSPEATVGLPFLAQLLLLVVVAVGLLVVGAPVVLEVVAQMEEIILAAQRLLLVKVTQGVMEKFREFLGLVVVAVVLEQLAVVMFLGITLPQEAQDHLPIQLGVQQQVQAKT